MKMLVVVPVEGQEEIKEKSSQILEKWTQFQNQNNILEDLDIEFILGEEPAILGGNWELRRKLYYYTDNLINQLKERTEKEKIGGILIDPILTSEDEKNFMFCNICDGKLIKDIDIALSDKVPFYFLLHSGMGSFYSSDFYKQLHEKYNDYLILGKFNAYDEDYERMFQFFLKQQKGKGQFVKKEG